MAQAILPLDNSVSAQTDTPAAVPPAKPALKQEELDQILAPVALYPDSLLSQIFMAATYPLEIVQADRWAKENKSLTGDALAAELEKQTWDPSVKSLVNFPQVLSMMSEKLDVTVKLGDAFLADQKSVMDTVQSLRAKAQAQGNLKTTSEQKVIVEQAPSTTTQVIVIQSVNPQVIYVPVYSPTVVYGPWWYPAYPPYPYYPPRPPAYVAGPGIWFGVGFTMGVAWGYAWGGCNWGRGNVNINVNRNININNNYINRNNYSAQINQRNTNIQGGNGNNTFQHNPDHRKGVAYRDQATARTYGDASSAKATQARDAYRGRTDTGQQKITQGNANQVRGNGNAAGVQNQNRAGGGAAAGSPDRNTAGTRTGAFDGVNSGGNAERSSSQRGQASRSGGSSPSQGGGNRGGGGAAGGGGGGRR
jgi:uncharacterized membrane protein YgcG